MGERDEGRLGARGGRGGAGVLGEVGERRVGEDVGRRRGIVEPVVDDGRIGSGEAETAGTVVGILIGEGGSLAALREGTDSGISPAAVLGRIRCGAPGVAKRPRIDGGSALSPAPCWTEGAKPDWNMTGLPPAEEGLEGCERLPPSRVERIMPSSLPRLRCDEAEDGRRASLRRFPLAEGNGVAPFGDVMADGRKTASSPAI